MLISRFEYFAEHILALSFVLSAVIHMMIPWYTSNKKVLAISDTLFLLHALFMAGVFVWI
jgi:hypothetical protein